MKRHPWQFSAIIILLLVLIWGVFGQTRRYEFINYDDPLYVSENAHVRTGLSWQNVEWAFTHVDSDNWHPFTTLSHMLDCQLFGLNAGAHHLVNVLWHSATAVLLFVLLAEMTGVLWPSAFVAAVFAIHPLRVESVAWIAERKDVLSAFFFVLTLLAYFRWTQKPTVARYLITAILFACGLLSKSMLVTLPIVLLLLDYWPLNRLQPVEGQGRRVTIGKLIIEKIPFFILSGLLGIVTLFVQQRAESKFEILPLTSRISNAVAAYLVYIGQMVWPAKLALFYPHVGRVPLLQTALSGTALVVITVVVFVLRKTRRYLVMGWGWYLVMLLPVIGIIQVGTQAHADRYSYLPQIGLYVAMTWGIVDLATPFRRHQQLLGAAAAIAIAALAWQSSIQTSYWHDSEKIWRRTIEVTSQNNYPAQVALGQYLMDKGRTDEAISQFRIALARAPDYPYANFQLASALAAKGQLDEAIAHYEKVLAAGSNTVAAHAALAKVLSQNGRRDDAIGEYTRALDIDPNNSDVETALANLFLEQGRIENAIEHYQNIVRREPDAALPHYNLAVALHREGRLEEAIAQYKKALSIEPDYPDAEKFLGQALLQNGQLDEANQHLEKH